MSTWGQPSGQKGTPYRIGFPCNHCKECACGTAWNSSAMLPVFEGSFAQAKQFGELALRERDFLADRFNINFVWEMHLVTLCGIALREGESLPGALDHSFPRCPLFLLHLDPLGDL